MSKLGIVERGNRDAFESCECEKRVIVVPGDGNRLEYARIEVDC